MKTSMRQIYVMMLEIGGRRRMRLAYLQLIESKCVLFARLFIKRYKFRQRMAYTMWEALIASINSKSISYLLTKTGT
ncbi:hypothetical protein KUTeg_024506 [Tegillarca granosa]|uniref:Uncharacterized protein n=1 Tax=Tegillarca granosa TaxID=220873 RepID=A0ABQ9E374_TEGGR|nr:hypothetical protein KUTeg_024506 [Tegillarca granosa]